MPLLEGLEENAASEVVVALAERGIGASKERDPATEGRFRVSVANDDVSLALSALHQTGLPPRATKGVLESLGEGSLIPSRAVEKARWLAGTSAELEDSLLQVNGVLTARVHLSIAESDPFTMGEPGGASASVLLRHSGATPPLSAEDVRRLVSGAVSGLSAQEVAVVLQPVSLETFDKSGALAQLGPLSIARSSVSTLRQVLLGMGALNLLLVVGLLVLWSRFKNAQRAREPATEPRSESAS